VLTHLGLALTEDKQADSAKVSEGLACLREAVQIDERVDGSDSARAFDSRGTLAATLSRWGHGGGVGTGSADDASRHAAESIALSERSVRIGASMEFPPQNYLLCLNDLAVELAQQAPSAGPERGPMMARAVRLADESHRALSVLWGASNSQVLAVQGSLADIVGRSGDHVRSESLYRDLERRRRASWDPGFKEMINLRSDLAKSIAAQGRYAEALDILARAQLDAEAAVAAGRLAATSDALFRIAVRHERFLARWAAVEPAGPAASRIAAQHEFVERLRGVRRASGAQLFTDVPEGLDALE
jgi:hypothetical protein